eukprot:984983-Rhodomonas_salina.1
MKPPALMRLDPATRNPQPGTDVLSGARSAGGTEGAHGVGDREEAPQQGALAAQDLEKGGKEREGEGE